VGSDLIDEAIAKTSTSAQLWWVFVEMDAASTVWAVTRVIASQVTLRLLIKPDAEISMNVQKFPDFVKTASVPTLLGDHGASARRDTNSTKREMRV